MKIVHPDIDTQFSDGDRINVLTVENGRFFREICESMKKQILGEQGPFVLSEEDDILPLSKFGIYISDYFDLNLSDKKYMNKLYSMLCAVSDCKFLVETAQAVSAFCALFDKLNSESDIPLEYDEAAPLSAVLKAFDVRPQNEYPSFLEKLISYIDAIISLTPARFFCFVNLKANLSVDEIEKFYQYLHGSEIFVLVLETSQRTKRDDELNVLIDADLCEIAD